MTVEGEEAEEGEEGEVAGVVEAPAAAETNGSIQGFDEVPPRVPAVKPKPDPPPAAELATLPLDELVLELRRAGNSLPGMFKVLKQLGRQVLMSELRAALERNKSKLEAEVDDFEASLRWKMLNAMHEAADMAAKLHEDPDVGVRQAARILHTTTMSYRMLTERGAGKVEVDLGSLPDMLAMLQEARHRLAVAEAAARAEKAVAKS